MTSIALAWATFQVIEKPIRKGNQMVAVILLILLAAIAMIGWAGQRGWIEARSAAYGVGKIMAASGEWGYPGANMKPIQFRGQTFLVQGTSGKKVLFVGDSNMDQYWPRI